MPDIKDICRRAWEAVKLGHQPEFDSLPADFRMGLEARAEAVLATNIASDGDSPSDRFEREAFKLSQPEIPVAVQEELVEEAVEERNEVVDHGVPHNHDAITEIVVAAQKPKKKATKKAAPKVEPKKPVKVIKKTATKKPAKVAKKSAKKGAKKR